MIVISLNDCPPKVRGDLSKWFMEINTGVFVGQVSARVREELWKRICENVQNGRATMVYSTNNEQKMDFRVHNTNWVPIDFDGLKMIKRPLTGQSASLPEKFSKVAQWQMGRKVARHRQNMPEKYVVINLETTGPSPLVDEIIEIAAILIEDGEIVSEFSSLIRPSKPSEKVSHSVLQLTGIAEEELLIKGKDIVDVLPQFIEFIKNERLICHNALHDMNFLRTACQNHNFNQVNNQYIDVMSLARKKLDDVDNYKLDTLYSYFHLSEPQIHQALCDCRLIYQIYEKLKVI